MFRGLANRSKVGPNSVTHADVAPKFGRLPIFTCAAPKAVCGKTETLAAAATARTFRGEAAPAWCLLGRPPWVRCALLDFNCVRGGAGPETLRS